MEIVERPVILPENQSFLIKEIELKNNKGIIHTHEKYELNFIVDAYGKRFVAGNISNFSPGDLIFMAPGVPHCWEIDNKEIEPKAITIHFNKDFFDNALTKIPELGFLQDFIIRSKQGLFIKELDKQKLESLFKEITLGLGFDNFIKVLKLLQYIAKNGNIELLANTEFRWEIETTKNERIKKIHEFVFHNFQNEIKLNEVSSIIGLSEGAFCSFFKKSTKKTFFTFIKEVRIGYACKLLIKDYDKTISSVCFESGYNNLANFNRQFKEVTGMNPKEYRQKNN